MASRGLVRGGTETLNYESVDVTESGLRVAHSIAWGGRGIGYIVQKVTRLKEERSGEVDDAKFAWQPWGQPTTHEYYEAWYMYEGNVFPRNNRATAGVESFSTSLKPEIAYSEAIYATSPNAPGETYFHDTFVINMSDDFKGTVTKSKMVREAVVASVYHIALMSPIQMTWYNKFKRVAKHYLRMPGGFSAGRLAACLGDAIEEPSFAPVMQRKDLAIGWVVPSGDTQDGRTGQQATGLPTKLTGFLNLTSPHVKEANLKLGKQTSKPGFFANLFRHEDFKYQDWFKTG